MLKHPYGVKARLKPYVPGEWGRVHEYDYSSVLYSLVLEPVVQINDDSWEYVLRGPDEDKNLNFIINKEGRLITPPGKDPNAWPYWNFSGKQVSTLTLRDIVTFTQDYTMAYKIPPIETLRTAYEKRGFTIIDNQVVHLHDVIERYVQHSFKRPPSFFPQKYGTGVHISTNDETKLAYYPDFRSIINRRATKIKPGRYLKKYFGKTYSDDDIRTFAAAILGDVQLKLVYTFDEMYNVYRTLDGYGIVSSCMSGTEFEPDDYHPLQVYHNSDVGLAVMVTPADKPLARALFNRNTKEYPIIYGYWEKMEVLLKQNGFTHGSLDGANINYIERNDDQLVMPYIDGHRAHTRSNHKSSNVDIDGNTVTINQQGKYNCDETGGYIEIKERVECCICGDRIPIDEVIYTIDCDDPLCEDCHDNRTYEVMINSGRWTYQYRELPDGYVYVKDEDLYILNAELANYLGYVFSGYLDKWVDEGDMIYIESEEDYYPEEMCIEDEEGEWILK